MLKKILLALMFAITAITNVTHAEDDMKTVASKAYVDTQIETKQLKIPAANQPNVGAGETVMTYTATGNGQIGERGLYSDISSYDASTDGDKLITASALNATFTNLPTTPTTKLECANQADGCTLWTIVDQTAYGDMLPSGYTRLEYIESTGRQYIDTGISPVTNTNFEIKLKYTSVDDTQGIIGYLENATQQTNFYLAKSSTNSKLLFASGTAAQELGNISTDPGTTYTYKLNGNSLHINNIIKTVNRGTINTSNTVYIFGRNNSSNYLKAQVYYYKIYNDDNIVRDFIPAQRNSDNVVGMYDLVSGQFFTNAASSGDDFTPGPAAN